LARQLFFPSPGVRRSTILLVAADELSNGSGICEQIAVAISNLTGEVTGIIESSAGSEPLPPKKAASSVGRNSWHNTAILVTERVQRISCGLLRDECGNPASLNEIRSHCPRLVLSAGIADSDLQLFCNLCEAAVLVITADVTRRDAALRAKEELLRHGVQLLGAVLDQRKFPIPESWYRRL
jgi:hypothetical protein